MTMARVITLLCVGVLGASSARAAELPTRIELYTMGPGDDVFEAFGHAALCVISDENPRGLCYNYGTADYADPAGLFWGVLRGRAMFEVASMPLPLMLQAYVEDDRSVYRQKLDLSPDAADAMATRLDHDNQPENRAYLYNHYRENCATRLRDHLDAVADGALARGSTRPYDETYRELTARGFASSFLLLAGMEVLVGRQVDRTPTVWEAMFLPDVLRAEVARTFKSAPEAFHLRTLPDRSLSMGAGRAALILLAVALTLLLGLAAVLRSTWVFGLGLVAAGLTLGVLALTADGLAAVALLPELRRNEVLLVLLPTDLGLMFLRGRTLKVYLAARGVLLVLVAAGLLAGVLVQPMWPVFALAAGPVAMALFGAYRVDQV